MARYRTAAAFESAPSDRVLRTLCCQPPFFIRLQQLVPYNPANIVATQQQIGMLGGTKTWRNMRGVGILKRGERVFRVFLKLGRQAISTLDASGSHVMIAPMPPASAWCVALIVAPSLAKQ